MSAKFPYRRSKRAVMVVGLAILSFLLMGCFLASQPVYDRPEAVRDHLGVFLHTGGEAVDIAAVASLEATADNPRAWVATPYSVRTISADTPVLAAAENFGQFTSCLQTAEWMTARADGRVNKAIAVDAGTLIGVVVSDKGLDVLAGPNSVGRLDGLVAGNDVAALNGMVYVADGSAGLKVIDAAAPLSPVLRATVDAVPGADAVAVAVPDWNHEVPTVTAPPEDRRVLLVEGGAIHLYDCTIASAPVLRSSVSVPGVRRIATQVRDGVLYVFATTAAQLRIYRVEPSSAFALVGSVDVPGSPGDVSVCADHAWVAAGGSAMGVNVTTLTAPICVGSHASSSSVAAVAALRDRTLTAEGVDGTHMYWASDVVTSPPAPVRGVVPIDVVGVHFMIPTDYFAQDTIYILDEQRGIFVYTFTGPPVLGEILGLLPWWAASGPAGLVLSEYAPAVGETMMRWPQLDDIPVFTTVKGRTLTYWAGIGVGEDWVRPVWSGELPVEPYDVEFAGVGGVHAALGDLGMASYVWDGLSTLETAGVFAAPSPVVSVSSTGLATSHEEYTVALVGTQDGTLYSIECTEAISSLPAQTRATTSTYIPAVSYVPSDSIMLPAAAGEIAYTGPYALVAMGDAGVAIVRADDISNLTLAGVIPAGHAEDVAARGDTVFVTTGEGLEAWDISSPSAPLRVGRYVGVEARDLTMYEGLMMPIAACGERGVSVFSDVRSDPGTAVVECVEDGAAYFGPAYPYAEAYIDTSTLLAQVVPWSMWDDTHVAYSGPGTVSAVVKPRVPYSWESTAPGIYRTRAYAEDVAGNISSDTAEYRIVTQERVAGANRYGTAVAASQRMFPSGATTVVVATGFRPVDALVAVPLAHALGAPVLLSESVLPTVTADEIRRLGATDVIIVGGSGAVPAAVVDGLAAAGVARGRIERLAGPGAPDTARVVALRLKSVLGKTPRRVYVANRQAAPDLTVIAGIAAHDQAPILLADRDSVPWATRNVMDSFAPTMTVLAGGAARISSALPFPGIVVRLAGATRYDTARYVANWMLARGLPPTYSFLANGDDLFGGVSAAGLCAYGPAPVLFADAALRPPTEAFLIGHKRDIVHMRVVGGTAAVSSEAETQAMLAIGLAEPGPRIPTPSPPQENDPLLELLFFGTYTAEERMEEMIGESIWDEMGFRMSDMFGFLLNGPVATEAGEAPAAAVPGRVLPPTRQEVLDSLTPQQRAELDSYLDPPPPKPLPDWFPKQ